MAKIAVELEHALACRREAGTPGGMSPRVIARGDGWSVTDVMCTCGPQDRPYEERHGHYAIAIVLAGRFQYRSPVGSELMTSGSLMLGNFGQCFECGHQHSEGDRCVSFWYEPEYFERLTADAGARGTAAPFRVPRLPPLRPLSPLSARAGAGASGVVGLPWEEFAVTLAVRTVRLAAGVSFRPNRSPLNAEARVGQAIRAIDRHPDAELPLGRLAREAGLSPDHFLRTFTHVTGITPHQYVLRTRLREAAWRLATETDKVIDIALDCGFGDVSNFDRAFRTEFGLAPSAFRRASSRNQEEPGVEER